MHKQFYSVKTVLAGLVMLVASSCSKSDNKETSSGVATYALGIGITTTAGSTNYVVKANSLDSGTISAANNGLTLVGYRDYGFASSTIFALGGLGETNINGITQDGNGNLILAGSTTMPAASDDIVQVSDKQMMAVKLYAQADGDQATFTFIDIATKTVDTTISSPTSNLIVGGDNPIYTGVVIRDTLMFLSYMHFTTGYATLHTDTNYVAVYSYPNIKFKYNIYDTRTGPTGAWQTKNGMFKDEKGDIYAMSSSNISNGFSQATKPGGFLRIKSGAVAFDESFFWNTDDLGGKISHIKYLGNGKVFATISTLANQTADDRWGDKSLKMSVIDVYNKTITDVKLEGGSVTDLIHNGNGGRSFPVLYDNGKIYYTATIGATSNIYIVDIASATAKKGAQIDATFVGGIFKMN